MAKESNAERVPYDRMKAGAESLLNVITIYRKTDEWRHRILPTLSVEARSRGWRLLRGWDYEGSEGIPSGIRISGVITDYGLENDRVKRWHESGCPIVKLGHSGSDEDSVLPSVGFDLEAEGELAAEHFQERNFQHIACDDFGSGELLGAINSGFCRRAGELNLTLHPICTKAGSKPESTRIIRSRFLEWLGEVPKPIGILARTDFRAAQFVTWVQEAGFAIPEDVGLVGRGNDESICECVLPTLSSVEPDEEGRASAAFALLADLIAGGAQPESPVLIAPIGVKARESTNILATSNPHVASALRYIWEHLDLNMSVDDIARAAGVPRRKLERAFKKDLNRGVNAELRRRRLETFRDLLVSSDEPIADLAVRVGFNTPAHLRRSFRKEYGISAREFRKQARHSSS